MLANLLSAPKHEGQKSDQFFPAVESQDQLKKEISDMLSDPDTDRQRDHEFERIEREKDRRAQADMLRAIVEMNRPSCNPEVECFKVKFDAMEDKDDVDSYLEHFERIAALHRWPRHVMAVRLLPLLKGQARDCVRDIPDDEITSNDVIKRALLFRFKRTPEYFRKKFRTSRREEGESFLQAVNKMVDQAKKWCTMKGCNRRDPDQVWDLFMQEACFQLLPPELETRVREREPSNYQDIAKLADTIFEARSATRMSRNLQPGSQPSAKPQGSKPATVPVSDKSQVVRDTTKFKRDGCHACGALDHFKRDCPSRKKVNVSMVVTEPEPDVPDLSVCDICAKSRVLSVSMVVTTLVSTPDPGLSDNDQEREFKPQGRARVNGKEVTALRDTGSETVVVAACLVKEVNWTGREERVRLADASICRPFKTAIAHLESPYISEKVEAIVMDHPSAEVITGNRAVSSCGRVIKIPVLPGVQSSRDPGIPVSRDPGVQRKKTRRGKKQKKGSPSAGQQDLRLSSATSVRSADKCVRSVYGQATPVDTSKRDREIEERMRREDTVPKYSPSKKRGKLHRGQVSSTVRATVCDSVGDSPTTSRRSAPVKVGQSRETREETRDPDRAERSTSAPTENGTDTEPRGEKSSQSAGNSGSGSQGRGDRLRASVGKDSAEGASCASSSESTEAGARERGLPHYVDAGSRGTESRRIEVVQDVTIKRERSKEMFEADVPINVYAWIFNFRTGEWEHYDGYVIGNVYVSSEDFK